ncbi:MAG TPA: hypothetical protein VE487_00535 [Ilumatobacter sp.]|nr:hypothetical protein [Ilumatobacter sp.]
MKIESLRILPPFAIGRLGSGAPLDSYVIEVDDDAPLDWRTIVPTTTFQIDLSTGAISREFVPKEVEFTEKVNGVVKIRKVAPFLELWAVTDDDQLVPVTIDLLRQNGVTPTALSWDVNVGNRKVERRTGDPGDAVTATVAGISDHAERRLRGTSPKFVSGAGIDFGAVRYIRPTPNHPEIRFRFTPADGVIYATTGIEQDKGLRDWENVHFTSGQRVYDSTKGKAEDNWYQWSIPVDDGVEDPWSTGTFRNETFPPSLFAIVPPAPSWLHGNVAVSRGYLDDACDGIVDVSLALSDRTLTAAARITAGPPALVPDALFVRSLADDLEQALEGPEVAVTEPPAVTRERAEEIVRRAFETVRFMNVAVMNGEPVQGRPPLSLDTMPAEEAYDTDRLMRPVMAAGTVDTLSVMAMHQQVYAALRGGAAPWFVRLLRSPQASGDFTDDGRRRMPALMCGADGNYLALTHRQIATIARAAANAPTLAAGGADPPPPAITPRNRTAQMQHIATGNPFSSSPAAAIANCCPGLEVDFRAVWRRILKGITLREYDNLVLGCDIAGSDLVGHRLLAIDGEPTMVHMVGPSPADLAAGTLLTSEDNPTASFTPEWSNQLAQLLKDSQGATVTCVFTADPVWEDLVWWEPPPPERPHGSGGPIEPPPPATMTLPLVVRTFFEGDTAVISRELAVPGELTQGLCSPWQNDFRECSCYYWASARPDFVNVETTADGRSTGDNWLQKVRTGTYVPDDYLDERLLLYDDLLGDWERWLRFQVRGRDTTSGPPAPRDPS